MTTLPGDLAIYVSGIVGLLLGFIFGYLYHEWSEQ